ncbi:hypothetical protein P5E67_30575, partial [Vibrio parahaemolyticus]|nr:hypothetical protein [Vibrio parahaemolyticus]
DALKSGVATNRLFNETTWNKQHRRKRTDNTKKRFWKTNLTMRTFNKVTETTWNLHHQRKVTSASKSAFLPTNSPSGVATKNRLSIALHCQHQRTKQPLGQLQNFGLETVETEF